jgi:hypothetical protein
MGRILGALRYGMETERLFIGFLWGRSTKMGGPDILIRG